MDAILLTVVHLGLLAVWSGSMAYSLVIVQPRLVRALGHDDDLVEHLLFVMGANNRRPVVAIIVGLFLTLAAIAVTRDLGTAGTALVVAEAALLATATAVFANVSWRLWPARVFALPEERPGHRRALRRHGIAMTGLAGASFVLAAVTAQL